MANRITKTNPRCEISHKTGIFLGGYTVSELKRLLADHPLLSNKESQDFKNFFRANLIKRSMMSNKALTTSKNDIKVCVQIMRCLKSKKDSSIYYLLYDLVTTNVLKNYNKRTKKKKSTNNNSTKLDKYEEMSQIEKNLYAFVIFMNNNIVPIVRQYENNFQKNYSKTNTIREGKPKSIVDFNSYWELPLSTIFGGPPVSLLTDPMFNEVSTIEDIKNNKLFNLLKEPETIKRIEDSYEKLLKSKQTKSELCQIDPSIKCQDDDDDKYGTHTLFYIMGGLLFFAFSFEFAK